MIDTLDLCTIEAGGLHFACALSQVGAVVPWPASTSARLTWPPLADGIVGSMTGTEAHVQARVIYPPARWGMAASAERDHPPIILLLQGGRNALAVNHYAFGTWPVVPAIPILQKQGIYALALHPDGDTPVLDFAYLGALL